MNLYRIQEEEANRPKIILEDKCIGTECDNLKKQKSRPKSYEKWDSVRTTNWLKRISIYNKIPKEYVDSIFVNYAYWIFEIIIIAK